MQARRPDWVPKAEDLEYGHKRVLALDGGGIHGILIGVVLEYLEQAILDVLWEDPKHANLTRRDIYLADYFDVIAGTSSGGLLALYLAARGDTYDELGDKGRLGLQRKNREEPADPQYHRTGGATAGVQIYRANAKRIFKKRTTLGWIPSMAQGIRDRVVGSKYGGKGIEKVAQEIFGDDRRCSMLKLTDLTGSVLIPSFDTRELSPFIFSYNKYTGRSGFTFLGCDPASSYGADELHDVKRNFPLWQVARATLATPTFFPVAIVNSCGSSERPVNKEGVKPPKEPFELIDGGVVANNPALHAVLVQARMYGAHLKEANRMEADDWMLPTEFAVLSIGPGTVRSAAPVGRGGRRDVMGDVVMKVLTGGASDLGHIHLKALMGNLPKGSEGVDPFERNPPCPYLRIQKKDTSTDDPHEVAKLADVLGKPLSALTDDEKKTYRNCLSVMDDVSDKNMDMLERIGDFLGRFYTGQRLKSRPEERPNLLKKYVREYLLAPKKNKKKY